VEVNLRIKCFLLLVLSFLSPSLLADKPLPLLEVSFTQSIVDPEAPQFIDSLSNYAGTALMYVQPAKDGRHLLQSATPLHNNTLHRLLGRLQKHELIEGVRLRTAI
jgi:hypothetical protein